MSTPHRIRLQGPWQVVPPEANPADEPLDVRIPATWRELFGEVAGTASFQRTFNTPTNLSESDRILIRIPAGAGEVQCCSLNSVALTSVDASPDVFDVTEHLSDFNLLEIRIQFDPGTSDADAGGLHQPVVLEIHSADESQ
ncbi:hypothetical protein SH661x_000224 [Planctomicrobium sp. SH661]|uniref:hypothetical protein n=1 Tax=Planctomicrobium sp. SH661 TaxID=3448124 RepID=UPI003F5BAD6C